MDEFEKEVLEQSSKIIKNFNPKVIKEELDKEWLSVLIKDKNSDFQAWMDFNFIDESVDWNKFIFYKSSSKDMIEKAVMDNDWVYDLCLALTEEAAYNHRKSIRRKNGKICS